MAEIVRAGILSVDEGQTEAAHALGMTRLQTMRRIVLPQAMRVIIPPTGNETISMLKTTSLVSVIAYTELLYSAQLIYAAELQDDPAADRGQHLVPGRHRPSCRSASTTSSAASAGAGVRPTCSPTPLQRLPQPVLSHHARTVRGRACEERRDGQGRGRAQALRPARGAQGHHARGAAGEVMCLLGPSGLGQVDVPALHQPPGEDRRRAALGRRRAGRLPPVGRQAPRAAREARSRASAPRSAWSSSASTCSRT